ncbi:hypothetical protein JCM8208_004603 [Rhodotorula glutinis]
MTSPISLSNVHAASPSGTRSSSGGLEPGSSAPGPGGASPSKRDRKGKAKEGFGSSPISYLPLEVLAHVFAQLPPHALGTCQLVCRLWNDVVGDEGSWRTAFETYYGVEATSLGRRLEPSSWRSEYISRVSLLRQWHRARTPTVIHNPSLGAVHHLHISLPAAAATAPVPSLLRGTPRSDAPSLTTTPALSVSLDLGAAIHSAPFTGKLSKRPLLSSPIDHLGRPLGLPILAATSFAVSADGTRLVWGMRDGSLRFANSSSTIGSGGRGTPGGALEAGEVRSLEPGGTATTAHREGAPVHRVAFSNAGGTGGGRILRGARKQRADVFVSAAADGVVAVWSLAVPPAPGARVRPAPAVKLWQGRWDVAVDAPPPPTAAAAAPATAAAIAAATRPRVKPTALAFDAGWLGRHHGRPASIAVGRSDGKTVVWPAVSLEEASLESGASLAADVHVVDARGSGAVDTLELDPPTEGSSSLALLAHQAGASTFSRHVFNSAAEPPKRTLFGHSASVQLAAITALAVDFDDPPALNGPSIPATPAEGKITFARPADAKAPSLASHGVASSFPPALSRSTSEFSVSLSRPESPSLDVDVVPRFGRRKYVAAGDAEGRVYLWDWEARQSEDEQEKGDVVGPGKQVQGTEIEDGGGQASKVTALESTDVGVFVGGLDGTLRFYSSLGPSTALSPPIRSFRDRSAPRHPSRLLAQGLVAEDEEERWLVSHVRANRDAVVAAIGGRVLAWRVSSEVKKKAGKPTGSKLTARQERFKANMELQHQVRESISAISIEQAARVERHEEQQRMASEFGVPPALDTMTEEEAVAFALMLSAEEQERHVLERSREETVMAGARGDGVEWEQVPDEWLEGDDLFLDEDYDRSRASTSSAAYASNADAHGDYDDDEHLSQSTSRGPSRTQSLSTSLSVPSSPFLRGHSLSPTSTSPSSRNLSYTWTPVSPSLRALGSPPSAFNPNAKLHISPRLGPTYGSQGASFSGNEPVPDMAPEMWPAAPSSSSPMREASPSVQSPPAGSRRPSASPSPLVGVSSPPPTSPSTSATPVLRGWSAVARPADPSPHPRPASFPPSSSSPTSSPALASSSPSRHDGAESLLSAQLRATSASEASVREDEARRRQRQEEEDLRYAIELSLAEEASRMTV